MRDEVTVFLATVRDKLTDVQAMMRREGFVIDDLDDRWQKFGFTLYTEIAAMSMEAKRLVDEAAGGEG